MDYVEANFDGERASIVMFSDITSYEKNPMIYGVSSLRPMKKPMIYGYVQCVL